MDEVISSTIDKTANFEAALRTILQEYHDAKAEMAELPNAMLMFAFENILTAHSELIETTSKAISSIAKEMFVWPEMHNRELSDAETEQTEASLEELLECTQDHDPTGAESKEPIQDNVARLVNLTKAVLAERGSVVQSEDPYERVVLDCIQYLGLSGDESEEASQDNVTEPAESDRDNTSVFHGPEKHNGELSTEKGVVEQTEAFIDDTLECIQDLDLTGAESREAAEELAERERDNTDVLHRTEKIIAEVSEAVKVIMKKIDAEVEEQVKFIRANVAAELAERTGDNTDVFCGPEKH